MIDLSKLCNAPFDPKGAYITVLKDEPTRFGGDVSLIEHFFVGASQRGASDFSIKSEGHIHIQLNGRQYFATKRTLHDSEVGIILAELWRSADAIGIIRQGRPLDFAYEINIDRSTRQRYRVNATGITINGSDGVELTVRSLPQKTPSLVSVALEPELIDYLNPKNGLIVIAGGTGHGKSTTMAAITRYHLENYSNPRKIVDYQSPIEYSFRDILDENEDSASFIVQSEVGEGRNIPSFGKAIWASLRRAPQIINVGESRDYESMSGCLAASVQGHIVNTTTHAGSVAEALRRMVLEFPAGEQTGRAYDLITSLKVLIAQHLVPTPDRSGRFAIREYMVFTDDVRDRFASVHFDSWPTVANQIFEEAEQSGKFIAKSLKQNVKEKMAQGILSEEIAKEQLGAIYYQSR